MNFATWWPKAQAKIVAWGAVIGSILLGLLFIYRKGVTNERSKNDFEDLLGDLENAHNENEQVREQAQVVKEVHSHVHALPSASVGQDVPADEPVPVKDAHVNSAAGRLGILARANHKESE